MTVLELSHLTFSYGDLEIIRDLNLAIQEGEFVTLLGPSGSGKSTIFQIIGGLVSPSHGDAHLNGRSILGTGGHISYMPQTPSLLPWRTVLQNVCLGQELQGKKEESRAEEMLEKAGLSSYRDAYPRELSGGMQQRVAFLRACASPQPIMLLDEPFSALDEWTRQEMISWLMSIWAEYRKTVFLITHNIEEALMMSDRVLLLSRLTKNITKEIHLPFTRPRDKSLSTSDDFFHYKREIMEQLRES